MIATLTNGREINLDDSRKTPNFYEFLYPVELMVLHTTLGAFNGAVQHLINSDSQVSAHFVIGREGQVAFILPLNKAAWHAGNVYNPSERAKKVLKKDWKGSYVNPNRYSYGLEFACGYDIDRDGVIEGWEKLYTPAQIKTAALIHLWAEEMDDREFDDDHTLTHKDIASYKPDLEVPRIMYLSEVGKQRQLLEDGVSDVIEERKDEVVKVDNKIAPELEIGAKYEILNIDGKVVFKKTE